MKVWDVTTGEEALALRGGKQRLVFSPDGKSLASSERLWDATTGQEVNPFHALGYWALSPDWRLSVALRGRVMKVCDAATGKERLTLPFTLHSDVPPGIFTKALVFSADGRYLAQGYGGTGKSSEVKIWDVTAVDK